MERGAKPPEASEELNILIEKSMECCNFLRIFNEMLTFFKYLSDSMEFSGKSE